MSFIIENPVFGLVLTLLALEAGILIQKKTQKSYLNPLMLSIGNYSVDPLYALNL